MLFLDRLVDRFSRASRREAKREDAIDLNVLSAGLDEWSARLIMGERWEVAASF